MKFSNLLHGGILVASIASAQTLPITGPQVDPNTVGRPVRQDIEIFQNSGEAWDLYIQALQSFMQTDSTQLESYFQVAGIHGYPNVAWDGVTGNSDGVGYCAHNTVTFPTWHRPYMALFEQIIVQIAQSIAPSYPDSNRATYLAAAQTLRIPFWDWSVNANIPAIANVSSIQINTPNGAQTIDNPLYRYTFPPSAAGTEIGNVPFTARRPNADQLLGNQAKTFHAATYALYSTQPDYAQFANAAYSPGGHHFPGFHPSNSLEHVHNLVHQNVGGQMGDLTVAAFDPLFYLHHANVDRIFAIWQAIYPDQFTVPWNTTQSDYVIPTGTTVDVNTPLYPFHSDDQGTLFTSADVRSTKSFGYTYPEVMDWGVNSDPAVLKSNVTAIVNQIYNPTGSSTSHRRGIRRRAASLSDANAAPYNWVIGILADKSLLNQTLSIHFYLSTPPDNSQLWSTSPLAIGSDSIIISRPANSSPPSSPQFISGQTFINAALLPLVNNIKPSPETLSFLKSNLQWRATYADGSVANANEMHSLGAVNVTLMGQTVMQTPELDRFPVYGEWTVYGDGLLGNNGWSLF